MYLYTGNYGLSFLQNENYFFFSFGSLNPPGLTVINIDIASCPCVSRVTITHVSIDAISALSMLTGVQDTFINV